MIRRGAALALVALATLLPARAEAGDPDRVWMTLETPHFVIHYYQPLDEVARRVSVVAERAHAILVPALGHAPREKTQVLLIDDTDSANGFANVLPRNTVVLFATAPSGSSGLADHDDWMYGLVAHEYTHILHLDTISGLPRLVNALVGKTWAPNQIQPRWVIEGLATYEESKRSSGGRTRNTSFDMSLRVPVLRGEALGLDQISGAPRAFPRGNAAYLYGSHFLRYVFDRFGDDAARRMSQVGGSQAVPFAINRQIAEVVGRPFDALYDDWRLHLRDKYALQMQGVERRGRRTGRRLTFSGETNVAPHYTADGKELWWLGSDGTRPARLQAMPVGADAGAARDLRQIEAIGTWAPLADGSLVFEQSWAYRRDYQYQDLVYWDHTSDREVRLTRGQRARDPAVSPDEREVAFSMNGEGRSVLAVIPLRADPDPAHRPDPVVLWRRPGRFDRAFQPAWSPDGRHVAFSAWRTGGYRDILVVERRSGAVTEVTHDRAIDGSPRWSPDGARLYFDSDRTGISNLYAYDWAERELWQVTNVDGGAFEVTVSPDGRRLAYHGFVGTGYDLFEIMVDPSAWIRARPYVDDRPDPVVVPDADVALGPARPYQALDTLAPQAWTAQLALSNLSRAITLNTGGSDVAGLHGYTLAAAIDLERGDLNLGGSYGYGGLRPSLRASFSRSVAERTGFRVNGMNLPYTEESLGATLSVGLPGERRPDTSWGLSLDYDLDWSRLLEVPTVAPDPNAPAPRAPLADYRQAGVATRLSFGNTRGALYATGPTEGSELSLSARIDHPALGAEYRALQVNWTARTYLPAPWGKTPTFALRLAGGVRAGDLPRTGAFGLGAIPAQDVVRSILDSARFGNTGYLRGYPPRTVAGAQFHLLNVEYRHELLSVERGLSTLPAFLKRVHLAGLLDAGTAFDGAPSRDALRLSVGGALRVDAFFGYYVPGTFELGYARGLLADGLGETWFLLTGTL